jgi:hypothetical protein
LIASVNDAYIKNIGNFNDLVNLRFNQLIGPNGLPIPELIGIIVIAVSVGT